VLLLDRVGLGKRGEALARRELVRRGYAIAATRYRTRHGEIDIVAREGRTLVFVEVKARRSGRFGPPAEAVTWKKRRRITAMAVEYLSRERPGPGPYRFDVVAVRLEAGGRPAIEVIRGAFEVGV
jgi:putative endonuclease